MKNKTKSKLSSAAVPAGAALRVDKTDIKRIVNTWEVYANKLYNLNQNLRS